MELNATNENRHGLRKPGSPYSDEECDEIISKLEQLLDGELNGEKKKEVVEMVNNCEYCLEQYRIEKSLRNLIRKGFSNLMMGNSLVNSIKESIKKLRTGMNKNNTGEE
jgi:anti-sigma factor (TIGR02949 family)